MSYTVPRIPGVTPRSKPGPFAVVQIVSEEARVKLTEQGYFVDEPHVCIFTGTEPDCDERIKVARSIIAGSDVDVEGVSFVIVPTSELAVA